MAINNQKFFKDKDEVISMFIGLAIVVVFALALVSIIMRSKGNVEVPGVSSEQKIEVTNNAESEVNNVDSVIVEKNDSLWKIAVRVYNDGYKWTEIAKANNLKNPGLIYTGQKLILPKIEKTATIVKENTPVLDQNSEYTVVRGDSLWKIAVKFYSDGYKWTEIYQTNKSKLNSPDKLEIGMKLLIYGKI